MGPLVASLVADIWSWRWFFGVNVVLLAFGFVALAVLVPELPSDGTRRIPVLRLVLVLCGTAGVVGGIQHASSGGWASVGTVLPITAGAVFLLGVFLLRRPDDPLPEADILARVKAEIAGRTFPLLAERIVVDGRSTVSLRRTPTSSTLTC